MATIEIKGNPVFIGVGDQPLMQVRNLGPHTVYYGGRTPAASTGQIAAGSGSQVEAGQDFVCTAGERALLAVTEITGSEATETFGAIEYDEELGDYPARNPDWTAALFIGDDAPTVGGSGAREGVDLWVPLIEDT